MATAGIPNSATGEPGAAPDADAELRASRRRLRSVAPLHESACGTIRRLLCSCRSSARVPLAQRWEMDPLRKWYHYNVFPRTLILHFAIVAVVTAQIYLLNSSVRGGERYRRRGMKGTRRLAPRAPAADIGILAEPAQLLGGLALPAGACLGTVERQPPHLPP